MTETAAILEAPAPVSEFVSVARIRNGEPHTEELLIQYTPAWACLPARLLILSDWRDTLGEYRRADWYDVEPVECASGVAVRLHRERRKVERDPQHDESYGVHLDGDHTRCECKGFSATDRQGRVCKHVAALNHLLSIGAL